MNAQWLNARMGAYARTGLSGAMKARSGFSSVSKTEWLALGFVLLAAALWWRAIEAPDEDYRPQPALTLSQRIERVIEANNRAGCASDPVWCRSFLRRLLTKARN